MERLNSWLAVIDIVDGDLKACYPLRVWVRVDVEANHGVGILLELLMSIDGVSVARLERLARLQDSFLALSFLFFLRQPFLLTLFRLAGEDLLVFAFNPRLVILYIDLRVWKSTS